MDMLKKVEEERKIFMYNEEKESGRTG